MVRVRSTAAAALACAGLLVVGTQFLIAPFSRYQVAAAPGGSWRIDTVTGQVSICRASGYAQAPVCSPFGAQSLEALRGRPAVVPKATTAPIGPQTASSDIDAILQAAEETPGKP